MIDGEIKSIYTLSKKDKDGHQEIIKKKSELIYFLNMPNLLVKRKRVRKNESESTKRVSLYEKEG